MRSRRSSSVFSRQWAAYDFGAITAVSAATPLATAEERSGIDELRWVQTGGPGTARYAAAATAKPSSQRQVCVVYRRVCGDAPKSVAAVQCRNLYDRCAPTPSRSEHSCRSPLSRLSFATTERVCLGTTVAITASKTALRGPSPKNIVSARLEPWPTRHQQSRTQQSRDQQSNPLKIRLCPAQIRQRHSDRRCPTTYPIGSTLLLQATHGHLSLQFRHVSSQRTRA